MSGNRMFPLLNEVVKDQTCLKSTIQDPSWLWHYKYEHLNFKGLKILQIKNIVKGLPPIQAPSQICEECVIAKQHRDSFPKTSNWRANQVFKLIHLYLCGPMNPASNGNKKVFCYLNR